MGLEFWGLLGKFSVSGKICILHVYDVYTYIYICIYDEKLRNTYEKKNPKTFHVTFSSGSEGSVS